MRFSPAVATVLDAGCMAEIIGMIEHAKNYGRTVLPVKGINTHV